MRRRREVSKYVSYKGKYCFAAACKFEVRPLLSVAKFMEMENGGTVVG